MRTVVDLINLSPSTPLDGDVPERVWTGKDLSYKHLRVVSCRAYVHIPKMKDPSLMTSANHEYSWDTAMRNSTIDFMT